VEKVQPGRSKASEAGGVKVQGFQKAIDGDGGNRLSRWQDRAQQVGDNHLSHGRFV